MTCHFRVFIYPLTHQVRVSGLTFLCDSVLLLCFLSLLKVCTLNFEQLVYYTYIIHIIHIICNDVINFVLLCNFGLIKLWYQWYHKNVYNFYLKTLIDYGGFLKYFLNNQSLPWKLLIHTMGLIKVNIILFFLWVLNSDQLFWVCWKAWHS